jgi:hypothetical protein
MSDTEYTPPSKQFQKMQAYERKHAKQIANDISWYKIPRYRKHYTINLLLTAPIVNLYFGWFAWIVVLGIWWTGPTYFYKKFGLEGVVVQHKKYQVPLQMLRVALLLAAAFGAYTWAKSNNN